MIELRWIRVAETTTAPDVLEYRYVQPCIDASGALCPGEWTEWKLVPLHVLPPNPSFNRTPGDKAAVRRLTQALGGGNEKEKKWNKRKQCRLPRDCAI